MDTTCDACGAKAVQFDLPHLTRCYRDAEVDDEASVRVFVFTGRCRACGERTYRVMEPQELENGNRGGARAG